MDSIEIDPTGASLNQVLKFNGTKFVPATDATGSQGVSYEETIGNNTDTTFTITHNLGTKDVNVIVRENINLYEVVDVRWEATTINVVTVDFSAAPTTNSKRVIVKGPGTKDFYSTVIGDGSNSTIVVNHGLGSRNIVPVIRSVDSPFEVVEVLSYATSLNSITLDFSAAPEAASLIASVYLLDLDNSYIETIGDGTNNEFTITHNLDTRDIGLTCRSTTSPYEFIPIRWEATSVNTAKVIFSSPPTVDSRKIGIYKALGGAKDFNDEITLDMLDGVSITSASNGQFLSWNGTNWVNASAPGGAGIDLLAIGSNVIPSVDNFYTLGNASLRWKSISIGSGTIYITDAGNNNQVALTINNGVFNIDGIVQAQLSNIAVTNLTFSDSTVQTTAARGFPAGGTSGQLIVKNSSTDYDYSWAEANSIQTSTVKHLVKNDSGAILTKGTVVYTNGANGSNILVKKALATNDLESSQVLGFVESNIAINGTGYVINNGIITNINTNSADAAGDPVWLSPTTAGEVVYGAANKPYGPNHVVYLGVVTRKNANTGEIFVHISNGWELEELHNVDLKTNAPSSGQFLKYNGSVWINDTIDLSTDTTGDFVSSLVAGTGITLSNNSGEGATPTITVNTSVIQARVANVSDTEIGYLDGVTSAIQTQLNNKANSNSSPVITLSGDLSGSATLTNLGNATLSATIVANSVALGTDTTGNYMSDISAGTGIAVSHTPGEGSTATVSIESTAWTAYTPTITADGGGFALNNGTLTGRYKQVGKTVFFKLKFVFGSTTAAGTGHWNFSLPVTAYDANFTFSAAILDNGNAWYGGIGNGNYTGSTSSFAVIIPGTSASVTTWATVGNGGPFIWGDADNITISGSYEAA